MSAEEEKKLLRHAVLRILAAMTEEQRRDSDRVLFDRLLGWPPLARAKSVLLFAGRGIEPDTRTLIATLLDTGKRIALPRCLPGDTLEARVIGALSDLVPGAYGILEPGPACAPIPKGELDCILVPALCFDRTGARLGRGGGYYDRYLSDYSGATVGLCRNQVLQDRLPVQPHDQRVGAIVTEGGIWAAPGV